MREIAYTPPYTRPYTRTCAHINVRHTRTCTHVHFHNKPPLYIIRFYPFCVSRMRKCVPIYTTFGYALTFLLLISLMSACQHARLADLCSGSVAEETSSECV